MDLIFLCVWLLCSGAVSWCSPGWSWTWEPPVSASCILGICECATTPDCISMTLKSKIIYRKGFHKCTANSLCISLLWCWWCSQEESYVDRIQSNRAQKHPKEAETIRLLAAHVKDPYLHTLPSPHPDQVLRKISEPLWDALAFKSTTHNNLIPHPQPLWEGRKWGGREHTTQRSQSFS